MACGKCEFAHGGMAELVLESFVQLILCMRAHCEAVSDLIVPFGSGEKEEEALIVA